MEFFKYDLVGISVALAFTDYHLLCYISPILEWVSLIDLFVGQRVDDNQ